MSAPFSLLNLQEISMYKEAIIRMLTSQAHLCNIGYVARTPVFLSDQDLSLRILTRSNTKWLAQLQKKAGSLKIHI